MPSWGRVAAIAGAIVVVGANSAAPAGASIVGEPRLVTRGVETPWELAPTGDGRTFVVERRGDVRVLRGDALDPGTVLDASDVAPEVNKFLGLALHPDFARNHLAYLYVSRRVDGVLRNGIWRLRDDGGRLRVDRQVFDGIDSDGNHDGGRMVFGPDRALYVTTGDIHQPARPQDLQNFNGKVLRFAAPGTETTLGAPADNPFVAQGGNARFVWSRGHRHPQGLAFDAAGRLWESEHGPTGEQHGEQYPGGNQKTGRDEVNLIVKGGNYGWPLVSGDMTGPGLIPPIAHADDSPAWAPGDLAVGRDGELYAPFLAGTQLHELDVDGATLTGQSSHFAELGRLRLAVADGDGLLLAQDGADAGIYRVSLTAPPAQPQPQPTTPTTPAPGPTPTPTSPTTTTPATTATTTPTVPAPGATIPVTPATTAPPEERRPRALADAVAARALKLGRRGLQRRRAVRVRVALPAGRTVVTLRLGTSRGALLARATVVAPAPATRTTTVRIGPRGVARLRASTRRRVVVTVASAGRVVHAAVRLGR